jgi:hypothetical protein
MYVKVIDTLNEYDESIIRATTVYKTMDNKKRQQILMLYLEVFNYETDILSYYSKE